MEKGKKNTIKFFDRLMCMRVKYQGILPLPGDEDLEKKLKPSIHHP